MFLHQAITATRAGLMALRPVSAIAISTSIARVEFDVSSVAWIMRAGLRDFKAQVKCS